MDISTYISELFYEHDCVIIPGFGGFICNYKPSEIHPVAYTITPPSKAISFNKNLKTNDGLLLNYIAQRDGVSIHNAEFIVNSWVSSSQSLLKKQEELSLRGIGKLFNDIEGNLQFVPDETINYLKSSFGLRTITALTIPKTKTIEFTEKYKREVKTSKQVKGVWRVAATFFLVGCLGTLFLLMQTGRDLKFLRLDESSVFGFISTILRTPEIDINPLEVPSDLVKKEVETSPSVTEHIENLPVDEEITSTEETTSSRYYIIVGAFKKHKNIKAAKNRLTELYPGIEIISEQIAELTRVGYYAGSNPESAHEQLLLAREGNASCWLLEK